MTIQQRPSIPAAYGGPGWQRRQTAMTEELGTIWRRCGLNSEWAPLKAALLHCPGDELAASRAPDAVQMLQPLDVPRARQQHRALADALAGAGVAVHAVDPRPPVRPNQMFVADLMLMTPEGAILGRPASRVRAGEERQVARRLADLGIPIIRSISGNGTFEGADAMWLDAGTLLVGSGVRTNNEGVSQIRQVLTPMGVDVIAVDLPREAMHLMGILRIVDRDLAIAWPRRIAQAAVEEMRVRGLHTEFIPSEAEAVEGFALNVVTVGPRRILMPEGNPITRAFYESLGVECISVAVDELAKAAGAVGCLTGVLERERI